MRQDIIDRLFPTVTDTIHDVIARYPRRVVEDDAMITRVPPSPTGFVHIGTIYSALISERFAHQTGGLFFLRIEDTDQKREVEGSAAMIPRALSEYGISTDEGPQIDGTEKGIYGPYFQSKRGHIYDVFIKHLLQIGRAYPCFATPEELEAQRSQQQDLKIRPGYYGSFAPWRDANDESILAALDAGKEWVIRFRSEGNFDTQIPFNDFLKGERQLSQNDQDIVIRKRDSLPTYHLAHVVDDYLMGTTHVIRGDEWFSSVALHLELFATFGWQAPIYGHISPILKSEQGSKRKLSKRKDPEASVDYYRQQGYPAQAVIEYLLNIANSDFEDWRKEHQAEAYSNFILKPERFDRSGALFDFRKLDDVSKDVIARMSTTNLIEHALVWLDMFDTTLASACRENSEYTFSVFNIERVGDKIRKDIAKWSDIRSEVGYFFDSEFAVAPVSESVFDQVTIQSILSDYCATFDLSVGKEVWFANLKQLATRHDCAQDTKTFKQNPTLYKGHVGDIAQLIRIALTGKTKTPDLYEIQNVLGKERVLSRLAINL